MISHIRERLTAYKPQDINCVRSIWASVIIPIHEIDNELYITLTKRAQTVRHHKGEVSFPGGMFEEKDGDRMVTGIRECCEEIGVKEKDLEILGRVDDMYTMTGFCIRPYVASIPYPYAFKTNPKEVAYIISLPFRILRNVSPILEEAELRGHVEMVPSFYFEGNRIWGATCRILLRLRWIIDGAV